MHQIRTGTIANTFSPINSKTKFVSSVIIVFNTFKLTILFYYLIRKRNERLFLQEVLHLNNRKNKEGKRLIFFIHLISPPLQFLKPSHLFPIQRIYIHTHRLAAGVNLSPSFAQIGAQVSLLLIKPRFCHNQSTVKPLSLLSSCARFTNIFVYPSSEKSAPS